MGFGDTVRDMIPQEGEAAAPAVDYAGEAMSTAMSHLNSIKDSGTAPMHAAAMNKNAKSATASVFSGTPQGGLDDLPVGAGHAYLTHLFKRQAAPAAAKKASDKGVNIYTDQQEALRSALNIMGVYSEKNPGGMPIEITEAKKLWFGDKKVDETEEAQWRTNIEQGDTKIDPKKMRKFVNYDGSLTWEVLNDDKTVMSRFTMGEYNGTKIFAQGGYKKFAELLNKVKQNSGPDSGGSFDAINRMVGG